MNLRKRERKRECERATRRLHRSDTGKKERDNYVVIF